MRICPHCETREIIRRVRCKPCANAEQSLSDYWREIGIPIARNRPGNIRLVPYAPYRRGKSRINRDRAGES